MEDLFAIVVFLFVFLIWTIASFLPFAAIGFIIYRVVKHGQETKSNNSRVATPFLSTGAASQPAYRCEHCDSTVEKAASCPNCGAPVQPTASANR